MPLTQSIGGIFNTNLSEGLERFLVLDTGVDRGELEVVLLLESPHAREVEQAQVDDRYPLAGATETSAGRHVRDKLAEWVSSLELPEQPIGQLVHQECNAVRHLGIMNVSQLPFQEKAYSEQDNGVRQNEHWSYYIKCMKHIKKKPYVRDYRGFPHNGNDAHLRDEINDLQAAIIADLRARLEDLYESNPNVLLVPCGEVAAAFFLKAMAAYLPHPTRRSDTAIQRERGWGTLNGEEQQHKEEIVERLSPS